MQFSQLFGKFQGSAPASSSSAGVQPAVADTNPADAPYPLWNASTSYPAGYKVVENGEIYQAKWYNSGDDPSAQVQFSYQARWVNQGVSPATESTDPSGSAWKALYSVPGEPSGAPALGSVGDSSPAASASPSPSATAP